MREKKTILLSFDVEDWFQVENFKSYIDFSTWNSFELRVEKSTHKILDLLDSFSLQPKATFFILGWIAEKVPQLVREINLRGHEVASHGMLHHLCTQLSRDKLLADLIYSKSMLEDIIGERVYGYRAPSFAISDKILPIINDAGFLYDSSYNSFDRHDRYGKIGLEAKKQHGIAYQINNNLYGS